MKTPFRIILSSVAAIATFAAANLTFRIVFGYLIYSLSALIDQRWIVTVVRLSCAFGAGGYAWWYVWKKTESVSVNNHVAPEENPNETIITWALNIGAISGTKERYILNNRFAIAFIVSIILGYLVWWFSLLITGRDEPWDTLGGYYPLAMGVAGFIGGLLGGKIFYLWPLAIIIGETVFIIVGHFTQPPAGASFFIPVGLIALFIYSVPSFVGSAIGVGLSRLISKCINRNKN